MFKKKLLSTILAAAMVFGVSNTALAAPTNGGGGIGNFMTSNEYTQDDSAVVPVSATVAGSYTLTLPAELAIETGEITPYPGASPQKILKVKLNYSVAFDHCANKALLIQFGTDTINTGFTDRPTMTGTELTSSDAGKTYVLETRGIAWIGSGTTFKNVVASDETPDESWDYYVQEQTNWDGSKNITYRKASGATAIDFIEGGDTYTNGDQPMGYSMYMPTDDSITTYITDSFGDCTTTMAASMQMPTTVYWKDVPNGTYTGSFGVTWQLKDINPEWLE